MEKPDITVPGNEKTPSRLVERVLPPKLTESTYNVLSAAILDSPNVEVTDILNVDWSGTIFSSGIPNSPKTALYGGIGYCVALNNVRIFLSADARRVYFNSKLNGEWVGWGRVDLTINHEEDGGYG